MYCQPELVEGVEFNNKPGFNKLNLTTLLSIKVNGFHHWKPFCIFT